MQETILLAKEIVKQPSFHYPMWMMFIGFLLWSIKQGLDIIKKYKEIKR